jgi:hypothetical protein
MLVVPAIQEAEVKGWLEPGIQGQPEQHNETMPQKKKKKWLAHSRLSYKYVGMLSIAPNDFYL